MITRDDGAPLSPADLAAIEQKWPVQVSDDGEAALARGALERRPDRLRAQRRGQGAARSRHRRVAGRIAREVTGGPAFGADIANSFSGANITLLAVTAAVVALLLIVTYRSPVLWLVPLAVIGFADRVAAVVGTAVAERARDEPRRFDVGHHQCAGVRRGHQLRAAADFAVSRGIGPQP